MGRHSNTRPRISGLPMKICGLFITASTVLGLTGCGASEEPALVVGVTGTAAEPLALHPTVIALAAAHAREARNPGGGIVKLVVGHQPHVASIDLTPMRNSEVEQNEQLAEEKIAETLPRLEELMGSAANDRPGLDALSVFTRTALITPTGGTMVIGTSGLQTEDPLDLRKLGWNFDPATAARDLKERDLLPDASGRRVVFVGVGTAYGTQPELPLPAQTKLKDLWGAICHESGAASCEVIGGTESLHEPVAVHPVPVVPVEPTPTSCEGTILLPEDVSFAPGSPVLHPAADSILGPLAETLSRCRATSTATVIGHTARVDTGSVNGIRLASERAWAVYERLLGLGAPPSAVVAPVGIGDAEPLVDNMPGGVFVEELAQINRRVEITVVSREEGQDQ